MFWRRDLKSAPQNGGETLPLKGSSLHILRLTLPDSSRVYPNPFHFSPEMVPQNVPGIFWHSDLKSVP